MKPSRKAFISVACVVWELRVQVPFVQSSPCNTVYGASRALMVLASSL